MRITVGRLTTYRRECRWGPAYHRETIGRIRDTADGYGAKAKSVLLNRRYSGDSKVVVEHNVPDSLICLDDSAGESRAGGIEFGRRKKDGGRTRGVNALMGLLRGAQ